MMCELHCLPLLTMQALPTETMETLANIIPMAFHILQDFVICDCTTKMPVIHYQVDIREKLA